MSKIYWRVLGLVAVLSLAALACSGSSDDVAADGADTNGPTPTETVAEPAPTEPADDTSGDDTAGEETSEDQDESEVVLTDSFRGVTAQTIKVGYTAIDFEALNANFGLDLAFVGYGPFIEAVVADLNSRGGINGRMVELVLQEFLPVGATTADAACVALTEDEQVFAVLNGFAGPGAEAVNTCITGIHETILVGAIPTDEMLALSTAPWVTPNMNASRRGPAFARLFAETGLLDELGRIMLLSANPDQDDARDVTGAALEAEGADVAFSATVTTSGDEIATLDTIGVFLERARAEGVSTVVQFGPAAFVMDALLAAGDEFTIVIVDADSFNDFVSVNLDPGDRILGSQSPPDLDEPETARCVALAEAAIGQEVLPPNMLALGEPNYWAGAINTCRQMSLFEQIATLAGPDLTNDSFRDAIARMDSFSLPEYPFVSLGPDKFDARDSLSVVEWDHDMNEWVAISDAVDVS